MTERLTSWWTLATEDGPAWYRRAAREARRLRLTPNNLPLESYDAFRARKRRQAEGDELGYRYGCLER